MDFLDDDPAKVVGPKKSTRAVIGSDGRVYLLGSKDPDLIDGSQYDDIIISGGAHYSEGGGGPGLEIIDGKGGRDTVLVDGRRAAYKIFIPEDAYPLNPEAPAWQANNGFLYGSTVTIEQIRTGDRIHIINCERIVFLNEQPSNLDTAQAIEELIQQGLVSSFETTELIRQIEERMNDKALRRARLIATRDFAVERKKLGFNARISAEEAQRIDEAALQAVEKLHPDIMKYGAVKPGESRKYAPGGKK